MLFGFLTGHTQKIGFAVGVLILAQRQTVLVAKQSASLDILCGGRFRLGIGVGWNEIEFSATLWRLKFPRYGDDHSGCEWIAVLAQGVPAHVGRSSRGPGHVEEDPCYTFLPPAGTCPTDDDGQPMRAVVFVTEATPKGTARSPQEYVRPLLVLPGHEYATIPFGELHRMICDLLRGDRPRLAAEVRRPDGGSRLLLEDGSVQVTELGGA